jgi:Domain of unknown function (DUF4398)
VNERIRRRGFDGICTGLIAAAIAAGCASAAPMANTKVAQAGRAVEEARQAGATTSASMDLKMAEDKLKEAQEAVTKRDYEEASALADQATVDADYARARVTNQRVTKTLDDMKQNIQVLRLELERLPQ